jgi:hypothetical protein
MGIHFQGMPSLPGYLFYLFKERIRRETDVSTRSHRSSELVNFPGDYTEG